MVGDVKSLEEIGLAYGTDKSSRRHDFLGFYEQYLNKIRSRAIKVLEIGVHEAASLKMWRDYFPNGDVVGVDIHEDKRKFTQDRIQIEVANQARVDQIVSVGIKHGPFDLIVDDGSHIWDHQITTLKWLMPFLNKGGYYILEDLDTSFGGYVTNFKGVSDISAAGYLFRMTEYLIGDVSMDIERETDPFVRSYSRLIEFISYSRRTSVIKLRD